MRLLDCHDQEKCEGFIGVVLMHELLFTLVIERVPLSCVAAVC
jgi:hypothetical protein